jgi:hypothetical protein
VESVFSDSIAGPAIYQYRQADSLLNAFTFNVLGLCAAVECYNIVNGWRTPSETLNSEQGGANLKELSNGSLSMIGIAGIVAQEVRTGQYIFSLTRSTSSIWHPALTLNLILNYVILYSETSILFLS